MMSPLRYVAQFLGIYSPPSPVERGFFESLIAFPGKTVLFWTDFTFLAVLVVISWTPFKNAVLDPLEPVLRKIARTIRPEFQKFVMVAQQDFSRRTPDMACPICLKDAAELVVQTSCGHIFCGNCILEYWTLGSSGTSAVSCPLCRQPITLLMHDGRPGDALPDDRAVAIRTKIRKYNRLFSGDPRSWSEKPHGASASTQCALTIARLQHQFGRIVTIADEHCLLHGRMVLTGLAFVVYVLLRFILRMVVNMCIMAVAVYSIMLVGVMPLSLGLLWLFAYGERQTFFVRGIVVAVSCTVIGFCIVIYLSLVFPLVE